MSPLRRALRGLAAAGFVLGLIVAALAITSDFLELRGLWVALILVNGWGWIGAGLFAWGRRPDNRIGSLMVATGFLWLVGGVGLSDVSLLFTVGQVLGSVFFAAAIHVLLAFPSGRLETVGQRRIVLFGYVLSTILVFPAFLFTSPEEFCERCPDNAFLIEPNQGVAEAISLVINVLAVGLIAAVLVSLARRWRRATPPQRRLMRPVFSAGVA
ncbi:MAG TPA: hypothetical protein VEQ61_01130, partial [Thermoleophilaceae bacterium]|nr:hypothetical protein [Thermoleophilaceae bacterium]